MDQLEEFDVSLFHVRLLIVGALIEGFARPGGSFNAASRFRITGM